MVLFSSKRDMTVKNIAHESVHVTTEIFKDCNVGFSYDIGMDEHFAYLTGWAADCIHKVKTGNIQQDNILADK